MFPHFLHIFISLIYIIFFCYFFNLLGTQKIVTKRRIQADKVDARVVLISCIKKILDDCRIITLFSIRKSALLFNKYTFYLQFYLMLQSLVFDPKAVKRAKTFQKMYYDLRIMKKKSMTILRYHALLSFKLTLKTPTYAIIPQK